MSDEIQPIGEITHYFDRIGVAAIYLQAELYLNDWIQVYGNQTNFVQQVLSMEIDRQPIEMGQPEQEIAIKLDQPARVGDYIYPYSE